jgi:serine/threonine protein kinase/tetratricopeptide (TPR) repeat protein
VEAERWRKIEQLYHAALELEKSQRAAFIQEACGGDALLQQEVESLVAQSEGADSFLEAPAMQVAAQALAMSETAADEDNALKSHPLQSKAGTQEGGAARPAGLEAGQVFTQRFHLVRKLGEGGMGQVWLAQQSSPLRRLVALKLIKGGIFGESLVRRFQSERQSLAIMNHPTIAKVFEAGATEHGQPYFVMEYVPGLPITEYCDQKNLGIEPRLELFIQVCEGAQHAHQKAIIHRDLKPANILVVELDGKPVPRIIDFGLAKATAPVDGETLLTQLGGLAGTPGYMSPEQADPAGQDIDTRTDVYSLGVVLYVLLTGVLPLDTKQWHKQPIAEVLRKLREQEPLRPSTRVSTNRDSAVSTAEARATEPAQLVSVLRGDLDWITMRALEKDRARRYATPSELAADIQHYLNHEPIVARPASAGYRLQKYGRRHRVGVTVAAALVFFLAGFAVLQTVQLRRITSERDRATRERDRAARITDFMITMFNVSDPSQARGNTITAREVLDKASTDIDAGLATDPELQAQLLYVMGRVYDALGLYPKAEALLARAAAIRLRVRGPRNPGTLEAQTLLAWELSRLGRYNEAEKWLREGLKQSQEIPDLPSQTKIGLEKQLASTLGDDGRYAEAEKFARDAFETSRRVYGLENPETILAMYNLCAILGDEGKYTESEKWNRETLDLSRRVLGPDHEETIAAMSALASTLSDEGRYGEAEKLARETLDISRRVSGRTNTRTALRTYNLACIMALRGMPDQALPLLREAVAVGLDIKTALGMNRDPDLKSLQGDRRFEKIVADAKRSVASVNKADR